MRGLCYSFIIIKFGCSEFSIVITPISIPLKNKQSYLVHSTNRKIKKMEYITQPRSFYVRQNLTEKWKKDYLIENGNALPDFITLEFDYADMSKEARKLHYKLTEILKRPIFKEIEHHKIREYTDFVISTASSGYKGIFDLLVVSDLDSQITVNQLEGYLTEAIAGIEKISDLIQAEKLKESREEDEKVKKTVLRFIDGYYWLIELADETKKKDVTYFSVHKSNLQELFDSKRNMDTLFGEGSVEDVELKAILMNYPIHEKRRELHLEELKQEESRKEQEEQTKRDNWINEFGSEKLKLSLQNKYEHDRSYFEERTAHTYPDFECDYHERNDYPIQDNPSLEALKLLNKYPDAFISWMQEIDPDDAYSEDDENSFEAIVIKDYLKLGHIFSRVD